MIVDSWSRVTSATTFESAVNQIEKTTATATIPTAPTAPVATYSPTDAGVQREEDVAEDEDDGHLDDDPEALREGLAEEDRVPVHRGDEDFLEHPVLDVLDEGCGEGFARTDAFRRRHVVDVIREGIERGTFREVDPERTGAFIATTILGAQTQLATTGDRESVAAARRELERYVRTRLLATERSEGEASARDRGGD